MKRIKDTNDVRVNNCRVNCYIIRVKGEKDKKVYGKEEFHKELDEALERNFKRKQKEK